MTPQYVVLVGAARSGTKLLRDVLAEALLIGRVPYDIGYVWRYEQQAHPDDTLGNQPTSERTKRFVRGFIDRYAAGSPPGVVEKTVGNVLRIPTVADVLPGAHYVHLVRDGVDVIESARRQWSAKPDVGYLVGKARHFPPRLIPGYGWRYLRGLRRRRVDGEAHVGSWGPRYPGIDEDLASCDLLTVCARQWRHSVTTPRADFSRLGLPVIQVRYEDLVRDTETELARLAAFVGAPVAVPRLRATAQRVRPGREGLGRATLTDGDLAVVQAEVGDLLAELGCAPARGIPR